MKTLVLTLLLAAPAMAQTPAKVEAPVPATAKILLEAIDIFLTPQMMDKAGLTEAYAQAVVASDARRYIRARAISALAMFATPSARATLEEAAYRDADPEIRIQAVMSLSRAFGPTDKIGVRAVLRTVAQDAPETLRRVIVREQARLSPAR